MKISEKNNYIAITGAPGSGKTTLMREFAIRGITCIEEPARQLIAEQRAIGGNALPEKDPSLFVEHLLSQSIQNFQSSIESDNLILFDRGIPDVIAYARWYNLSLGKIQKACQDMRYRQQVFLLSPWEEIYSTDEERKMTFEQTIIFHEYLKDAYRSAEYQLIEVPQSSIEDRCKFMLGIIAK